MVRAATRADHAAILALMQSTGEYARQYQYDDFDGDALVDERDGVLVGFVRYTLGRPETWIRQLAVAPEYQGKGTVAVSLLAALMDVARSYGSQGIEGFTLDTRVRFQHALERGGGTLSHGARTRFLLTQTPPWERQSPEHT